MIHLLLKSLGTREFYYYKERYIRNFRASYYRPNRFEIEFTGYHYCRVTFTGVPYLGTRELSRTRSKVSSRLRGATDRRRPPPLANIPPELSYSIKLARSERTFISEFIRLQQKRRWRASRALLLLKAHPFLLCHSLAYSIRDHEREHRRCIRREKHDRRHLRRGCVGL